jgi:hypothetical protein
VRGRDLFDRAGERKQVWPEQRDREHSESRRESERDQQPIAWQVMIQAAGIDARYRCYLHPFDQFQCCILMLIGSPDGIVMFAFKSAMIHIVPATTTNTMRTPKASASTLLVLSGPLVMCRKNTR